MLYNFLLMSAEAKSDNISQFSKYAKRELSSMIVIFISISIFTAAIYTLVLPSFLNKEQTNIARRFLIISSIFIFILISLTLVILSKKDDRQSPEIKKENNIEILIDPKLCKLQIKFHNMIKEDLITILITFLFTISSVLVLVLYAIENGTLCTSYELKFYKLLTCISGLLIYILYLLFIYAFSSSIPTEEYYEENILELLEVNVVKPEIDKTAKKESDQSE